MSLLTRIATSLIQMPLLLELSLQELICLNCLQVRARARFCKHLPEELNQNYRKTLDLVYIKCISCAEYIKGFNFQKHQYYCKVDCNQDDICELCKYCKRTLQVCQCRVQKYEYSEEQILLIQTLTRNCQYCQKEIQTSCFQNHSKICPLTELQCDECRTQLQRSNYLKHQIKCLREVQCKINQQKSIDKVLLQLANIRFQQEKANLQHQFLCLICSQVCKIPLSCFDCWSLQCYDCVIRNKNTCGHGCKLQFESILTTFDYFHLNNILIKCKFCLEYLKYRKYRHHHAVCRKIQNFKRFKLKSQFKLINDEIPKICRSCKTAAFIPYKCNDCKKINCDVCMKNNDCCHSGFTQILPEFNWKLRCKSCICIIYYREIKKHLKYSCKQKKIKYDQNQILPFFKIFQEKCIKLKDINEQSYHQYKEENIKKPSKLCKKQKQNPINENAYQRK
ncbi:hypothetical protein pb186bvf_012973 [Paramecium bursaria]